MELNQRLKSFIQENYGSYKQFSKTTGIDYNLLRRIINEKSMLSGDVLLELHKIGISIDWLLSGIGDCYADSSNGQAFRLINNSENIRNSSDHINSRIIEWVDANFNSFDEFLEVSGIEIDFRDDSIANYIPTPDLMLKLFRCGCNIDWVMTGQGTQYANNPNGVILQIKMKVKRNSLEDHENNGSTELDKFIHGLLAVNNQ